MQLNSLAAYIARIKDAGVVYSLQSRPADLFRCELLLHYDPLVLSSEGKRLDFTNDTPVQEAIINYLRSLPFNGEYTNMSLVDSLQAVEGLKVVQLQHAFSKYGFNPYVEIVSRFIPDAGYMRLDEAVITFLPYEN
jgi:hypothetical protein